MHFEPIPEVWPLSVLTNPLQLDRNAACASAQTHYHSRRQTASSDSAYGLKPGVDSSCSLIDARLSVSHKETLMNQSTSRRRFVELTPFAGLALLAACSPKSEPVGSSTTSPSSTSPQTSPSPTPAPGSTSAPPAEPMPNTAVLPMLDEKDPQAVALGYVAEATRADTTRFKNYVAGNQCSNCTLYLGKAGEQAAPCPLFAGKNVAAKGWCTSWVKKA